MAEGKENQAVSERIDAILKAAVDVNILNVGDIVSGVSSQVGKISDITGGVSSQVGEIRDFKFDLQDPVALNEALEKSRSADEAVKDASAPENPESRAEMNPEAAKAAEVGGRK